MTITPPDHGGRLRAAAEHWEIPVAQWLDLSTGINPDSWPVPPIPEAVWRRLPEDEDGLEDAIREWSGVGCRTSCVPVAGSQAAIQALPFLRRPCRVGIPDPGYTEHGHWWARAGHRVFRLPLEEAQDDPDWADEMNVIVWIHPNNPTGLALSPKRLLDWQQRLARHRGWLVVDEAFADARPELSLMSHAGPANRGLIVLRSLGKFFGLAGVRAGAVLTEPRIADRLRLALGPWALSGPARFIMTQALRDTQWQTDTTRQLDRSRDRLDDLLIEYGLTPTGGTPLFRYILHADAAAISQALAREGVLVRYFEEPSALRIGLPGEESQWLRLRQALAKIESD
ncbi:MAG: threonine-phosphate decarboxylase [Oleiphilaceae bacterium]|nr:threonine-phosphate decarboxylase [Oleiphilaceae bacterium]